MATVVKFGCSSGPCSVSSAGRVEVPEETEVKGNCDPDRLLQCPFDKNHLIRSCRFPYHLIKCRKNHPKLAQELKTCPFNARHLVPRHELTRHTETCENRVSLNGDKGELSSGHWRSKVPVSTWVNLNTTEDWDEEADGGAAAAPFIWGQKNDTDKVETKPTNKLGHSSRAPSTLPWSNCSL